MNEPGDNLTGQATRTRLQRVSKWLAVSVAVLVLCVALTLGAFTVVMARVPAYRAQMQTWLSERAKLDIQFAELRAGWRGYGPELVFTQAVVRSADRQRILIIAERGGVGFDLWQALRTGRWVAARFSLQGTEIKVQRRTDGRFEVIGQADWPEFDADSSFTLDSLPVGTITIRDVRLSFRDLKTGRGPWALEQVTLDITRNARQFDMQGRANLPTKLGQSLGFAAHGEGNLNEVTQLKWRAQVAGTALNLAGWKEVMPEDWSAATGHGAFELSAEFVGAQPERVAGRVDVADVQLALPKWTVPLPQADSLQVHDDDLDAAPVEAPAAVGAAIVSSPELRYSNIGLAFSSTRSEQGWATYFSRLQLERDGSPWPAGTAQLLVQFDASASSDDSGNDQGELRVMRLQATAQSIVLDNLWPLLAYLPENEINARWRALNASGRLSNLVVRYEHPIATDAPRYGARVEFAQLGISPVGKTPGISGLSGVVSATGARGEVRLDSHDLALSIPRVFRTPLPVDRVTGNISWTRTLQGLQLSSTDFAVDNADGKAQAQLTLTVPNVGSPMIDMQAQGMDLNAAAAPRYMPAGIMPKQTLAWLDAAFPAGKVKLAKAVLKGPLQKFPFRGGEGLFQINAQIEGLTMNYQPGWIPATDLHINAQFRNAGLSAVVTAGQVNGLSLDRAAGRIKDYRDAEIFIEATTHGDLDNGLRFVQQSPVGPTLGSIFMQLSGRGELRGTTDMYFPLKNFAKRKVDINVALHNADVTLAGVPQPIGRLQGTLRVLNDAVIGADLRGQFLQGEFVATTEPVARGRYNVVASGAVQAQPLTQFLKLPAWIKLQGSARYRYTLPGFAQRDSEGVRHLYSVDSDLRGLSIDLPAPVNKTATSSRNLHIDAELRGNTMMLRGALGELRAQARLQQANEAWRFDRAGVRADGVAAALPAHPGLRVEGRLDEFVLEDWLKLGVGAAGAGNASSTRLQDILRTANVNIGRLRWYGYEWPEVRGILQATDNGWRIDVAGEQAGGRLLVPYEFASGRPVTLDMEVLRLTASAGEPTTQRSGSALDPRELPAVRADIKQFRYGDHDFGALQLAADRTTQGLQVTSLGITGESFTGTASGSWLHTATGQRSTLALALESNDLRATMKQFNYADFIAAKHAKLVANLNWPDGLDAEILRRASGTIEFQVDEGQLLKVEPGAGRVLGLFSVAALPRRLGLDFRDVTDKGLIFDSIHADFNVQNGDARTQNLLLRGPTAEIGIVGRMGLGVRDYDQTAVVTGDVGAALPVAGAVAGGPVVGAALLLFTQIFKEPLKGVARAYYHIGGTWDDPQVERIDADVGKASLSGAESAP